MSKNDFYKRKPIGNTILGKVARDYALRKAGIDPRSPEEQEKDRAERARHIRNFETYRRDKE